MTIKTTTAALLVGTTLISAIVVGMAILARARFGRWFWWLFEAGMLFAFCFVCWLIGQSIYVLGTLCPWCMVTWAVTIPTFFATLVHLFRNGTFGGSARIQEGAGRLMASMFPTVMLVLNLSTVAVLWFGGIRVDGGATEAYEALLRWQHPQYGRIEPALFIRLAEENGLIGELGRWVLDRACDDLASGAAHLRLNVNVSARQLAEPGFADAAAMMDFAKNAAMHSGLSVKGIEYSGAGATAAGPARWGPRSSRGPTGCRGTGNGPSVADRGAFSPPAQGGSLLASNGRVTP